MSDRVNVAQALGSAKRLCARLILPVGSVVGFGTVFGCQMGTQNLADCDPAGLPSSLDLGGARDASYEAGTGASPGPAPVGATYVSLGAQHACILSDESAVVCWGPGTRFDDFDRFAGQVLQISSGEQTLALLLRDGTIRMFDNSSGRWTDATHRLELFLEPGWPPGLLVDVTVGVGRDQLGCLRDDKGSVRCQYERSPTPGGEMVPGQAFAPVYGTFGNIGELNFKHVSAHSAVVGCGETTSGVGLCWTAAIEQVQDSDGGFPDPFGWRNGQIKVLESLSDYLCATPAAICAASLLGSVECWQVEDIVSEEFTDATGAHRRFGTHGFAQEPFLAFGGEKALIQISCGSRSGPLFPTGQSGDYHFSLCLLDETGHLKCNIGTGGISFVEPFGAESIVAAETNGDTVCGIKAGGGVLCASLRGAGSDNQILLVPTRVKQ